MTRASLGAWLVLAAVLGSAGPGQAQELRPHMTGWEHIIALEYGPAEAHGRPALNGMLTNISPYDLGGIRLLVDTLDVGGQVKTQQIAWVPGELRGGGRLYFSVPTTPAPAYRVRVYTYDRIESLGPQR
jgi:hypothetical protein